jgi:hypothetical protein
MRACPLRAAAATAALRVAFKILFTLGWVGYQRLADRRRP